MYDWRRMTQEERRAALALRKAERRPWHRPPHRDCGEGAYHLTAACFEHASVIGATPERMAECERELLDTLARHSERIHAWCVLPNHYHALVDTPDVEAVLAAAGTFHGRTSFRWNGEDRRRGRRVWYSCQERAIRSERHFWATVNYTLHNPVHHGYVGRWEDWPFSNAREYLAAIGRGEAARIWKQYPLLDYGRGWDDPDM